MGLSTTMGECLGADLGTIEAFWDPIAEANMAAVAPILDSLCVIISLDAQLALEIPAFLGAISFDIPEIAAALDLPMLNGWDISMNIEIDIDFALAPLEIAIGIITIPIDIVLGWIEGLIEVPPKLPEIPTIDVILDLVLELGFELPTASIECIAELIMIPIDAVAAAVELAASLDASAAIEAGVCPGADGEIDTGSLLQ